MTCFFDLQGWILDVAFYIPNWWPDDQHVMGRHGRGAYEWNSL